MQRDTSGRSIGWVAWFWIGLGVWLSGCVGRTGDRPAMFVDPYAMQVVVRSVSEGEVERVIGVPFDKAAWGPAGMSNLPHVEPSDAVAAVAGDAYAGPLGLSGRSMWLSAIRGTKGELHVVAYDESAETLFVFFSVLGPRRKPAVVPDDVSRWGLPAPGPPGAPGE